MHAHAYKHEHVHARVRAHAHTHTQLHLTVTTLITTLLHKLLLCLAYYVAAAVLLYR